MSIRSPFRPTVRLRLTFLYTGVVLGVGAVLLVVNYFLVQRNLTVQPAVLRQRIELQLGHSIFSFQAPPLSQYRHLEGLLQQAAADLRAEALHHLIVQSAIVFVGLALVSVALGWLVAGRALRPLKQMTALAKRLSERTLDERIGLQGPRDELRELADTFDAMLARLDAAFDSQQRFVANASHELRTPLSIIRAELDVTLSDPDPSIEDFTSMAKVVETATQRSERLIDSLLMLARSESPVLAGADVDLGSVVERRLALVASELSTRELRIETSLRPAWVRGDEVLLERLVENLLENAVRHNRAGGWIEVSTGTDDEIARLAVTNGGDTIAMDDVDSLFEPFRRLGRDRIRSNGGVGLGLAIVRAVVLAHGGTVAAAARAEGGLEVSVRLPALARQMGCIS